MTVEFCHTAVTTRQSPVCRQTRLEGQQVLACALGRRVSRQEFWTFLHRDVFEPTRQAGPAVSDFDPSLFVCAQRPQLILIDVGWFSRVPPDYATAPPDCEFPLIDGIEYPEDLTFAHSCESGLPADETLADLKILCCDKAKGMNNDRLSEKSVHFRPRFDLSHNLSASRLRIQGNVNLRSPWSVIHLVKCLFSPCLKGVGAFEYPDRGWRGVNTGSWILSPAQRGDGRQDSPRQCLEQIAVHRVLFGKKE